MTGSLSGERFIGSNYFYDEYQPKCTPQNVCTCYISQCSNLYLKHSMALTLNLRKKIFFESEDQGLLFKSQGNV